jgi:hypothetical protein
MKYKRKEKYKTLEAQLKAVKENGLTIEYIHNPSVYIHNPSEEVIDFLKSEHIEVFDEYFEEDRHI